MESLFPAWTNLEPRRRLIVILATVGMFAAVLLLARSASEKDLALLFGGLDPAAAGEVITALEQNGAVYEVRGSGIYVEANLRDSLRMTLAGEGLPAQGAQGYELLDTLSGFGTTSQMFDAAYWRAKEGELARTILANPLISAARVHISPASNRPFATDQKPTAAVTVTTNGANLGQQNIKALQYLVGSAVSGLSPSDVAVIDDEGGLLSESGEASSNAAADERADMLRQRAERLLAARVGAGNAVVELSLDTISQSEQIIERTVDPDSRIAISTDVTEAAETSQNSRGGDVTVASNLPDGEGGGGSENSDASETRSLTNYEFSETERQVVISPGAVRRMSVAVLVNDVVTTDENGNTSYTPRTEEELASLQALVSSAVGLDENRGDVITLRSLPFEPLPISPDLGTEVVSASTPINMTQLIQAGLLAAVALVLGLFVVRPILSGTPAAAGDDLSALPSPDMDGGGDDLFANMGSAFDDGDFPDFGGGDMGGGMPEIGGGGDNDAVERLRSLIAERENETVQILQSWIEDENQKENA